MSAAIGSLEFIGETGIESESVKSLSSVQSLSRVWLLVTPWTVAHRATLSITKSRSLLKLMSIKSVMPSNHLILCHPLLFLSSVFPSIRIFSNKSVLRIRWPKYWSISFSISPSSEYSGLISFWIDWLDLLAVQGTLKSLLQHHTSKASVPHCSAFFIVQLSHPYMTTGKTIALTRWTFVAKVMSLLFNMLSRLAIIFLPRSKRLLISWLQSPSAVILEPKIIKLVTQLSPTLCDPMDCSPPVSSVHRILQARVLEWVAVPLSKGSSRPRDRLRVSCIAGRFFTVWVTREAWQQAYWLNFFSFPLVHSIH